MKQLSALVLCTILSAQSTAYAQAGTLDDSYGDGGWNTTTISGTGTNGINRSFFASDGTIISVVSQDNGFMLHRTEADGTEIGTTPVQQYGPGSLNNQVRAAAMLANGKLLVAGSYLALGDRIAIARYNPDLTLDATFGAGGMTVVDLGSSIQLVRGILVLADDRILVSGGASNVSNQPSVALVMFNANGTLETSWGTNGTRIITPPGYWAYGRSMTELPDGKIIIVGGYRDSALGISYDLILRINANGDPDTSFDGDGFIGNSGRDAYNKVLLDPSGTFYALHYYSANGSNGPSLERRLANGTLDPSFDGDGRLELSPQFDITGYAMDMAFDAPGRIIICGDKPVPFSSTSVGVAIRVLDSGILDNTFGTAGQYVQASISQHTFYSFTLALGSGRALLTGVDNSPFGDRLLMCIMLQNDGATRVDELGQGFSIKAWPQPALDWLNVAMEPSQGVGPRAEVMDMSGRSLRTDSQQLTEHTFSLNVAALTPGTYIVRVTRGDVVHNVRFVKH